MAYNPLQVNLRAQVHFRTSALDAMYYDVISVRVMVRVRVFICLMHLIRMG